MRKHVEATITNGPILGKVLRPTRRERPFFKLQEYLDLHYPALSSRMVAKISHYVDDHFSPKNSRIGKK